MSVQMYFESSEELKQWALKTDVTCEHCGKLNYYPGMWAVVTCIACFKQCKFPVAFIEKIPVIFDSEEHSNDFEKEFESLKIACSILDYKFKIFPTVGLKRISVKISISLEKEFKYTMCIHTNETAKFTNVTIYGEKLIKTSNFREAFRLAKEAI